MLAVLVEGLGADSRIGMKRDGRKVSMAEIFLAEMCDLMEAYLCALSKTRFTNDRASKLLLSSESAPSSAYSPEEFDEIRASYIKD